MRIIDEMPADRRVAGRIRTSAYPSESPIEVALVFGFVVNPSNELFDADRGQMIAANPGTHRASREECSGFA
jgi:hypothetical protein